MIRPNPKTGRFKIETLTQPSGFDPENVLTGRISLTRAAYENIGERVRYVHQTLDRLKALPGVENAVNIVSIFK